MTPQQIALVQMSFAEIAPHEVKVARQFYEELFKIDPGLRTLFRSDFSEECGKVVQVLALVVDALPFVDVLAPLLRI